MRPLAKVALLGISTCLGCFLATSSDAARGTATRPGGRIAQSRTAGEDFQTLSVEKQDMQRRVVARGRDYVRMVRAGILPIGGGFEEFSAYASRVERTRRGLERDLSRLEQLDRQIATLAPSMALAPSAVYDRARRELIAKSQTAIQAAEERDAAFERAFHSNWNPSHTTVYGSGAGAGTHKDFAQGFASARGKLAFPVPGRSEIVRTEDKGGAPALEMTAAGGTEIHSVFPGRVAFVGEFGEHGLAVLVDHGHEYSTLYAGLGRVLVQVGAHVEEGTGLATLPDGQPMATLYFELRAGGNRLIPAPWFGI